MSVKNSLSIIILAAGSGTRMQSQLPKVLHLLAGKPLLQHVIETAQQLKPAYIFIVVGHQEKLIRQYFQENNLDNNLTWIHQEKQLGTAHAVKQVLPVLKKINSQHYQQLLILYADVPLISAAVLKKLITKTSLDQLGILTAVVNNPFGLGRIIRQKLENLSRARIIKIIEEKEASAQEKKIREINTGIYCLSLKNLIQQLADINNHNDQQEYYLTDIVNEKLEIMSFTLDYPEESQGINTREQLIALERWYQQQSAKKLLQAGVTIMDPQRLDIRGIGKINIAPEVIIDINVILEGNIDIQSGTIIGPNCCLKNVVIGKNVEIKSHCVIEGVIIQEACKIGPFARIRPQTRLSKNVTIGNFTEIKNTDIGESSKIAHLSYIGDTVMGEQVNIGAGTITCNYDGVNKHQTCINSHVFIGSDTQLVAPVVIGEGAFIGAGSTITKNVPAHQLTLSRSKQITIAHWKKPEKKN